MVQKCFGLRTTGWSFLLLLWAVGFLASARAATNCSRPFVLVNEQELAELRAELSQSFWKSNVYHADPGISVSSTGRGVRSNAGLWLHRTIEIPEKGGHFHYFFCEDGEQLPLPSDQRFVPGPYRCPKCGREYRGEKYEGGLRRMVHGWLARAALDLALVASLEHRPEYAAKSAEILSKYAQAYPGAHTSTTAGGMIFQSLDEAMWVIPLAQAYDLLYPGLSGEQRAQISGFLRRVAEGLQHCGTGGNWGSWHLSAVGVAGYAVGDRDQVAWATEGFKQQIKVQLGDDGLWPESVHTYHYFALIALLHFAEASWHAGVDLYHWEPKPGKSLLLMLSAPLKYAYPDLRLPAIHDGWFESFVPADLYELAYHRTGDPEFAWVIANGYSPWMVPGGIVPLEKTVGRDGLYAFLFGEGIPAKTTPPPADSVNFPGLGIAILRSTNGSMLTFDYGPFLGHGHLDKMGITLFSDGRLRMADYGTPGYGSAILSYYQSTFSHNTVVVDGKNQARTRENQAKLWLGNAKLEAVQSETREAYPGVSHTRTVVRVDDYFVIIDRLRSKTDHKYDLYFHGEGQLGLETHEQAVRFDEPSPCPWLESEGRCWQPGYSAAGYWERPLPFLQFRLLGDHPLTLVMTHCPGETSNRKAMLLIARQTAKTAQFATALFPSRYQPPLSLDGKGDRFTVRHGADSDSLTVPRDGAQPFLNRN